MIKARNIVKQSITPDRIVAGAQVMLKAKCGTTSAQTGTYSNTPDSPTFVYTADGALSIDGVSPVAGDIVLLKDQGTASENGLFQVVDAGSSSSPARLRRPDALAKGDSAAGLLCYIDSGTTNADTFWVCTTAPGSAVVGTNDLTFSQSGAAGMSYATTGEIANVAATEAAGTSATVARGDHVHDLPESVLRTVMAEFTAAPSFNSQKASSLAAGTADTDATIMSQVRALGAKDPVRAATNAALPAYTRSSNVITASANGALAAVDGVTLAAGERLLLKDGAAGADNGIYTVTTLGDGSNPFVLTRTTDFDTSAKAVSGSLVPVSEGTTHADTLFQLTTNAAITLNTTALTFVKKAGSGALPADATGRAVMGDGFLQPTKNATMSATGATNVFFGVPFVIVVDTDGNASQDIYNAANPAPFKFTIVDMVVECTGANAGGTIKLNNGDVATPGTDITSAVICAVDQVTRSVSGSAGNINDAVQDIASGGKLSIIKNGAADSGRVSILCLRKP